MSIRTTLNLTRVGLVAAGRQFVSVLCLAMASYGMAPSGISGTIGDPLTEVGAGITTFAECAPQPAQHDHLLTSLLKVCAASLNPSTVVR